MKSSKEIREAAAAMRKQQRDYNRRFRAERSQRLKWILGNIIDYFKWDGLTKDQRVGRVVRVCFVLISALFSDLLFYFCFVEGMNNMRLSSILFFFYLIPFAMEVILYGFGISIISFTLLLFASLIIEPSNVYLLFFNLLAIYVVWNIRRHDRCWTKKSVVVCSLITGFLMSAFFYIIFIMVGQASFVLFDIRMVLIPIISVFPQAVFICCMLYVFRNKLSDRTKTRLGVIDDTEQFRDEIKRIKNHKIKPKIGDKVFLILLIEAVFLGFTAAAFANSLLPDVIKDDFVYSSYVYVDGEENAEPPRENDPAGTDDPELKAVPSDDRFGSFMYDVGMDETYAIARRDEDRDRFKFSESSIAYDLKLIMMLLCVIHPIVMSANALTRIIFTKPIEDMTGAMKGFNEDPESRAEIRIKLGHLGIHTGDEIEELYGVLYDTVGELNSYIDKIKEETKLREDLRVAKAASEAKSNFLSNVSHEIRTPINAVLGMDEMILRESGEKHIKKYAVDIKNSGKTLLTLVNDLLDFSKIEAGKMEILPVEYELSSVINDLINMVSAKAQDKGLALNIDVEPTIPHVLFGDEIRVKQCILNILNNAVKYTPKGSVTLRFVSRYVSDDEIALKVNVIDTGIGIKEEDLSKLFSPFERIEETRNRTIEGTGLGMSIVKQLLDMMGSKLDVKSVYGEGSDFSFEIIQKVINKEPIGDFNRTYEASLESMEQYNVSFVAPDAKLLVVDDTPMNLTVIKGLLKETAVQIQTATSGFECLEKVKADKYDIILMDQRMPEMDGTQTLGKLKEMGDENLSIDSPVIILTANVVSGAREGFIKAGFDDYLSKPIDAGKLEKMIAKYLPKEKVLDPAKMPGSEIAHKATSDEGAFVKSSAGKDADKSSLKEFYSNTSALDYEKAIAGCMNEDILKEALHDYYIALKEGPGLIEKLWKAGDIENYTIKVHALKSSSRIIGAAELSEKAAFLEKCGDEGDVTKIDEQTPELLSLYSSYRDILKPLFEEKADTDLPPIDKKGLAEGYMAIKETVSAFDYDTADAIIEMLKAYSIPEDERERFTLICDSVRALDRDKTLELINS